MIVIDASAAIQASLANRGFQLVAAHDPVAPRLLWSEVPSALHEMKWRGTISDELARIALGRFSDAPIGTRRKSLIEGAWEIADHLGWAKTYDAEYVYLARDLDCSLLTVDARLKRAASRIIRVIGPRDLRRARPDE